METETITAMGCTMGWTALGSLSPQRSHLDAFGVAQISNQLCSAEDLL